MFIHQSFNLVRVCLTRQTKLELPVAIFGLLYRFSIPLLQHKSLVQKSILNCIWITETNSYYLKFQFMFEIYIIQPQNSFILITLSRVVLQNNSFSVPLSFFS